MDNQATGNRVLYATFAVIVLICALGNFSQTVANGMLLAMGDELGFTAATGQWLATIYMLIMGITVPAVAFLGKRFSTRQVTCAAVILFLVGCAVDFAANSFWLLVVGRVLQAISCGITLPLVQTFPAMRFPAGKKATALGIAGIAMGFAPNIGPVLGGAAVETVGWRFVFIAMAVICIVLLVCTLLFAAKEEPADRTATLDAWSLVLSTLGFGGLLLGISNASSFGLANPSIWITIAAGIVFIIAFLVRQTRVEKPLINLGIFKSSRFNWTFAVQCTMLMSYMGITLIAPLYWQNACGGTAVDAGVIFIPATILALILNPLAGFLTDKLGARPVSLFGGISMTLGAVGMCFVGESSSLAFVTLCQTLRGAGMSCLIGPTMSYGLSELRALTPDGSSFLALVRQACASLGTAIMMLIVTIAGTGANAAFPYQAAFIFSAVFVIAMLICIVVGIRKTEE